MLSPIDGTFTSFSAEKNRTDIMFGVAVPKEELGERVKRRWGEKRAVERDPRKCGFDHGEGA